MAVILRRHTPTKRPALIPVSPFRCSPIPTLYTRDNQTRLRNSREVIQMWVRKMTGFPLLSGGRPSVQSRKFTIGPCLLAAWLVLRGHHTKRQKSYAKPTEVRGQSNAAGDGSREAQSGHCSNRLLSNKIARREKRKSSLFPGV
jgi:hypothetical protein